MLTTEGFLLGGALRYAQPAEGYRTGIEPVLLAAAVPARPGEHVLEAGTGAGAALMCLARRVTVTGLGVELDPAMAALARRNIEANGLAGLAVKTADVLDGAPPGSFDHAMANPPWHCPAATPSPVARRDLAKRQAGAGLAGWVAALCEAVRPGGSVSLILPAVLVAQGVAAFRGSGAGAVLHVPLWPKAGRPAKLAILVGRLAPGEVRCAPGLVLHAADGRYTTEADAILRHGHTLLDLLVADVP